MRKKCILFVVVMLTVGNIYTASPGLIAVLSSLSTTAVTAANTFTDNVLWESSRLDRMREFVEDNDLLLAVDIARASGETLEAVADIADVPEERRHDFYMEMKRYYSILYPSAQSEPLCRATTILQISRMQ